MEVSWPPTGAQAQLLASLATLLERGGAARFLDAPVARADERGFPERWTPTAVGVERTLVRLFWLSYVDLDVELDDRRVADTRGGMLLGSDIEWIENVDGVAHFQIDTIGNDNVAGLLCHEVGRAFMDWIAGAAPYRELAPPPPSLRQGTIAAIYLGLGVIATNASLYNRVASKTVGQMAVTETQIARTGGLQPAEAIYLLAVQAVLRAAPVEAHANLRSDFAEELRVAIAELTPHRAELADWLDLDLQAARPALERDASPPVVREDSRTEPDPRVRLAGERTYVLRESRAMGHAALGLAIGIGALIISAAVFDQRGGTLLPTFLGVSTVVGGVIGWHRRVDSCARCRVRLATATAATCPGCGATVAGLIHHASELHEREIEQDD